jgi:hypothetical protein
MGMNYMKFIVPLIFGLFLLQLAGCLTNSTNVNTNKINDELKIKLIQVSKSIGFEKDNHDYLKTIKKESDLTLLKNVITNLKKDEEGEFGTLQNPDYNFYVKDNKGTTHLYQYWEGRNDTTPRLMEITKAKSKSYKLTDKENESLLTLIY